MQSKDWQNENIDKEFEDHKEFTKDETSTKDVSKRDTLSHLKKAKCAQVKIESEQEDSSQ